MKNIFITILIFFSFQILVGQSEMEKGFQLLEKGEFESAETFFATFLRTNPENKTALLCYGRAMGLNEKPKKARKIFSNLLSKYPNDFEIQINYNESFLWAKEYKSAKPLYEQLVINNPKNFAAVLGLANTLSNLKEYESALKWVNKAIVLDNANESAKVSRKYIKLGYANEYVKNQEYSLGEILLKEIFLDFKEDKETLLNLANLYLITKKVDKAKETYWRYATNKLDTITALNGIALAEHIGENDKTALKIARLSKRKLPKINDYSLIEQTHDRYVQALIWNKKFSKAKKQIDSLQNVYLKTNWILALKATLGMYTGNFKLSLKSYNSILEKDNQSFDGNLGKANALFASDKIIPAYNAAFKTLTIFENQKDAISFIEKLNNLHTPWIEEHVAYTFDNGNNIAFSSNTTTEIPWSTKFKTTLSYQFRDTKNTVTNNAANSHVLLAGIHFKIISNAILRTVIGFNNSSFATSNYTQPVFNIKLSTKPFRLQNLDIGYQREVQSFNADLIEQEIVMNNYSLNYNLGTNFNLGWYSQLIHTTQTDNNKRNLLFTSLYYTLNQKPALKLGVNYQYLTFANQVPTIYFSPEKYQAVEVFVDFRGKLNDKIQFMANAATGIQKVEEDPNSMIFRGEAGIQHQFSKRLNGTIYGKYSNIASATAAGFEFTEIGIKVKWMLTKEPLFFNKLKKD